MRLGVAILTLWALAALLASLLGGPPTVDLARALAAPGLDLWAGADPLGRPLLPLVARGAATALAIALPAVTAAGLVGTAIGIVAGLAGGAVDRLLTAAIDVVLAIPGLLLAIVLAALLGPRLENLVLAIALTGWPAFARLARARARTLRGEAFVVAARAAGLPPRRIVLRHVGPALAGPIWVQAAFAAGAAVLAEGGLAFLGLADPTRPSWGSLLAEGLRHVREAPHLVVVPALATTSLVLAFNLIGEALAARARGA